MALNGRFEFPKAAAVDLIRVAPFDMGLTVERAEGVVVFVAADFIDHVAGDAAVDALHHVADYIRFHCFVILMVSDAK